MMMVYSHRDAASAITTSPVDLAQKKSEPRKKLKKAEFGIIRKQNFH